MNCRVWDCPGTVPFVRFGGDTSSEPGDCNRKNCERFFCHVGARERPIWQASDTSGFGGESLPCLFWQPDLFAQRFQPRNAAKHPGLSRFTRFSIPPSAPDDFTILPFQWLLLVAGADFETRPLLAAFVRFFLSIDSASNGSKKPACSRLSIAWRSREE